MDFQRNEQSNDQLSVSHPTPASPVSLSLQRFLFNAHKPVRNSIWKAIFRSVCLENCREAAASVFEQWFSQKRKDRGRVDSIIWRPNRIETLCCLPLPSDVVGYGWTRNALTQSQDGWRRIPSQRASSAATRDHSVQLYSEHRTHTGVSRRYCCYWRCIYMAIHSTLLATISGS